jgi:hypothetical protein
MKRIYIIVAIAAMAIVSTKVSAQSPEKIKGGSFKMSDMSSWTIGVSKTGEVGDAAFGNTTELPQGSKNTTCVKFSHGGAGFSEVQMYQRVDLVAGEVYKISAKLKAILPSMAGRAVQIYLCEDAEPDSGTKFSDAIINTGSRTKDVALFLEAWPFSMGDTDPSNIDGDFPLSAAGPGSDLFSPFNDGKYLVLFKIGEWGNPDPFSVSVSDLSLVNTSASAVSRVNSDNIHIFPTVISDNFLIIETKGIENSKLSITNLNGQSLYNSNLSLGRTTLNTSFLKSGMYLVKVTNGDESSISKIVIE